MCKAIINNENEKEFSNLPQRTIEYLTFLDFLQDQRDCDNDLVIISGEEWDKFYDPATDDEYEMKLDIVNVKNFFDKFAEITKTNQWKFESYFVSSKYIDEWTYNTMNLIVKINGINQRYIIDCV